MVRVRQGEIVAQFALDELTAGTIFSFLQAHRREIDAAFADAPAWRTAGTRTHEIEVRRPADITTEQAWPEYFDWFVRQLSAFQHALWPLVGRLPPSGGTRQWDEGSFFSELAAYTPSALAPARELLRWSQANMSMVEWGHGKRYGSFVPRARREGRLYGPFSVWTNGTFILRFAGLKKEWPFDEPAVRLDLLERVNLLPHLRPPCMRRSTPPSHSPAHSRPSRRATRPLLRRPDLAPDHDQVALGAAPTSVRRSSRPCRLASCAEPAQRSRLT